MKVVIQGAGIGGLTLGSKLLKAGNEVVILEKQEAPSALGSGLLLDVVTVKRLESAGVSVSGTAFKKMQLSTKEEPMVAAGQSGVAVVRPHLHESLAAACDGAQWLFSSSISRIEQDESQVKMWLKDTELTADLLIGADGLGSGIRELLGSDLERKYSGQTVFRAISPLHTTLSAPCEYWHKSGRAGIVPVPTGTYLYLVIGVPRHSKYEQPPSFFLDDFGPEVSRLMKAVPAEQWMQHDIDYLSGQTWGEGRVILLGDAAHGFTPNMGQGACQAIADAVVLAQCIAEDRVSSYGSLRKGEVGRVAFMSNQIGQIAHWRSDIARAPVNALLTAASWVMPAG